MKLRSGVKKGAFYIAAAAVLLGGLYLAPRFYPQGIASSVPEGLANKLKDLASIAPAPQVSPHQVEPQALPTAGVAAKAVGDCLVTADVLSWQSNNGLTLAVGGRTTTKGSIAEKAGLTVTLYNLNDYGVMQQREGAFAKALGANPSKDACPTTGAQFAIIMGDASPSFAAAIQPLLAKEGHGVEVIGAIGKSAGEDACMLPYEVKRNPQLAKGMIVAAVARDGDIHTCYEFLDINKIRFNPDPKTYDPEALNIWEFNQFEDADAAFIAAQCDKRPYVVAGKPTGQFTRGRELNPGEANDGLSSGCINGVATWTPGDEVVTRMRGTVDKANSTREFGEQMAAIVFGNRAWDAAHPDLVKKFLKAAFDGADQLRSSDEALRFVARINAQLYKVGDEKYWFDYFKGVTKNDKLGHPVLLGGSAVMNLADNARYFGLSGGPDLFRIVYETFAEKDSAYYKGVMPAVPPYEQIVNFRYLKELLDESGVTAAASEDVPVFEKGQKIDRVVGDANYTINFKTGSAEIVGQDSIDTLDRLIKQLSVTSMAIEIDGHTDNTGSAALNRDLSWKRADAVRAYLIAHGKGVFSENRIASHGYGPDKPIATNKTAAGKAQNRRVEVIVGTVAH